MMWEPRPVPKVTPETKPFWRGAAEGRLLLGKCADCGLVFYYPRSNCPDCLSENAELTEATGTGRVYSYSVAESVDGWPEGNLPIVVAYVELDEGPLMMTNLVDCNPEDISIGDRVTVQFVKTEKKEIAIPVFAPTD